MELCCTFLGGLYSTNSFELLVKIEEIVLTNFDMTYSKLEAFENVWSIYEH